MLKKKSSELFARGADNHAFNDKTPQMPYFSQMNSKLFGLPPKVCTNLAFDKHQGLLAYGTEDRVIKVLNLKGYEYELYEAHLTKVRYLTLIPNEGVMVSIDEESEVAIWDLRELDVEPVRVKVPDSTRAKTATL